MSGHPSGEKPVCDTIMHKPICTVQDFLQEQESMFTYFSKCKLYFSLRQKNNKGWRKRWFVFDGMDLRYFKDKVNVDIRLLRVNFSSKCTRISVTCNNLNATAPAFQRVYP